MQFRRRRNLLLSILSVKNLSVLCWLGFYHCPTHLGSCLGSLIGSLRRHHRWPLLVSPTQDKLGQVDCWCRMDVMYIYVPAHWFHQRWTSLVVWRASTILADQPAALTSFVDWTGLSRPHPLLVSPTQTTWRQAGKLSWSWNVICSSHFQNNTGLHTQI